MLYAVLQRGKMTEEETIRKLEEEPRHESMMYEAWLLRNPDSSRTIEDELMGRINAAFRQYKKTTGKDYKKTLRKMQNSS